ncbi:MAG: hypothetical protein M1827_007352 [Pycnora praestabilis]|nr:MAG: hypothetical protein M1827_007352 [Pycnora praestabilis]
MFFDGDLQSGISLAIQESKSIVCFVRDDSRDSSLWEDNYLQDEQVSVHQEHRSLCLTSELKVVAILQTQAISLRMQADSQEAGFLSAFCPISKAPTLVIIQKGQLREYLALGLTQEDFRERLKTALSDKPPVKEPHQEHPTTAEETGAAPVRQDASTPVCPNASTPQQPIGQDSNDSLTVQNLLNYRRQRLETEKRRQEAAEKAERVASAKVRREEVEAEAAKAPLGSTKAQESSYVQQQRKRQQDARMERERVLRLVENDKAERREKEECRKALARVEADTTASTNEAATKTLPNKSNSLSPFSSRDCAIQIRLLDGSTIRSRFSADKTLRTDVRRWIDEQRLDSDVPFTFKQILSPLPNRAITISEEEQNLQSLGLIPSTTLVLIPVQGFTSAYGSSAPGLLSRCLSAGYGVASSGVGMVTGALGTFLGAGQTTLTQQPAAVVPATGHTLQSDNPDETPRNARSNINIRTLRDQQDDNDDHQLYNGNQLNFEPNRSYDDKED